MAKHLTKLTCGVLHDRSELAPILIQACPGAFIASLSALGSPRSVALALGAITAITIHDLVVRPVLQALGERWSESIRGHPKDLGG